jgi:hypothetical protein
MSVRFHANYGLGVTPDVSALFISLAILSFLPRVLGERPLVPQWIDRHLILDGS